MSPSRWTRRVRRLHARVLARRRPLGALCAAAAAAAALHANAAPPPPRSMVLTAAHDLPGGVVVSTEDVQDTAFEPGSVPSGVVPRSFAVGRTTAGPVRAGEPITDARLLTTSLLAGYPGLSAVPVRLGDAAAARLLRVGDRVDVLAADAQGRHAAIVVGRDVPVLAIPRAVDAGSPATSEGALVVLAVPPGEVGGLAQASATSFLTVALAPTG